MASQSDASREMSPLLSDEFTLLRWIDLVLACFCLGFFTYSFHNHGKEIYQLDLQKNVQRLIFMSPLFAFVSWLHLICHGVPYLRGLLEFLQIWYDGYALYVFWCLLVQIAGGKEEVLRYLRSKGDYHCRLCGCLRCLSFNTAEEFYSIRYKHFIFQITYIRSFFYFVTAFIDGYYGTQEKKGLITILRLCSIPSLLLTVFSIIDFYFKIKEKLSIVKHIKTLFIIVKTFIIVVVIENVVLSFLLGNEKFNHLDHEKKVAVLQYFILLLLIECIIYSICFASYTSPHTFQTSYSGMALDAESSHMELLKASLKLWNVLESDNYGRIRLTKTGSQENAVYGSVNNNYSNNNMNFQRVSDNVEMLTTENPTLNYTDN